MPRDSAAPQRSSFLASRGGNEYALKLGLSTVSSKSVKCYGRQIYQPANSSGLWSLHPMCYYAAGSPYRHSLVERWRLAGQLVASFGGFAPLLLHRRSIAGLFLSLAHAVRQKRACQAFHRRWGSFVLGSKSRAGWTDCVPRGFQNSWGLQPRNGVLVCESSDFQSLACWARDGEGPLPM